VPLVAFRATVAGGVVAEAADRNGVAALTAALLGQGAGERDARAFAETVAGVGGIFDIETELEAVVLSGEFMARDGELMIELLADVLRRPALSAEAFARMRTRAVRTLRAARDGDLQSLLLPYAHAFVHGDHPYGRAVTGSEQSLERLRHQDVRRFYRDHFGADRLTVTVVGDFGRSEMRARLEAAFGSWREAATELPELPDTTAADGGRVLLIDKPGAGQTYFWIGNVGVARDDPDMPAVDLVDTLFGGRFTSMLNTALRVESGLTYGASSLLESHRRPGSLGMLSFCATENTVEAIDLALRQLDRLHDPGLDAAALASGRNYLLGTYTLTLETNPQLAAAMSELKFYGLPDAALNEYASGVARVSRSQTEAVIRRVYPSRDELVFVLIGDGDAIREAAARYGELTELSISEPRLGP
jgi:predicted Zn-dependent peptidase